MGEVERAFAARAVSRQAADVDANKARMIQQIHRDLPKAVNQLQEGGFPAYEGTRWQARTVKYRGADVVAWMCNSSVMPVRQSGPPYSFDEGRMTAPTRAFALRIDAGRAWFIKCDDLSTNTFVDADLQEFPPMLLSAIKGLIDVLQKKEKPKPWEIAYKEPILRHRAQ